MPSLVSQYPSLITSTAATKTEDAKKAAPAATKAEGKGTASKPSYMEKSVARAEYGHEKVGVHGWHDPTIAPYLQVHQDNVYKLRNEASQPTADELVRSGWNRNFTKSTKPLTAEQAMKQENWRYFRRVDWGSYVDQYAIKHCEDSYEKQAKSMSQGHLNYLKHVHGSCQHPHMDVRERQGQGHQPHDPARALQANHEYEMAMFAGYQPYAQPGYGYMPGGPYPGYGYPGGAYGLGAAALHPGMAAMDKNKDGVVDANELRNAGIRGFWNPGMAPLDKNRDGIVDLDELQAAGFNGVATYPAAACDWLDGPA